MQKMEVQTSRNDIHEESPDILRQLKAHIKMETLIPARFRGAYYKDTGRPKGNNLESFIWYFILRNFIGITEDTVFLIVLKYSPALYGFCGFAKLPLASDITTFRERYGGCIEIMFHGMVEITEPICREIDEKKAGYWIYDTSGLEANVKENNPKYLNGKLEAAKKIAKTNPEYNPYKGVYSLLPDTAEANVNVKQQYINGHFCYAQKFGIAANGLGIVRHLAFFDERFKDRHPEIVSQKTDNPDLDKEIADSASLKPVLSDFFAIHPDFKGNYHTFLGDTGFDSYDTYPMLRYDFDFARMAIPMNPRNSATAHDHFDDNGTPLCHVDNTPFVFDSVCKGQNRSERFKYICPKSIKIKGQPNPVCSCEHPCTPNSYKCTYVYPHKNLRLYPGIPRATDHWDNLYRHRVLVERTINIIKVDFGAGRHKSFSSFSAKAELFLAGISQLCCVILAHSINKSHLFKSARKLLRAA